MHTGSQAYLGGQVVVNGLGDAPVAVLLLDHRRVLRSRVERELGEARRVAQLQQLLHALGAPERLADGIVVYSIVQFHLCSNGLALKGMEFAQVEST